MARDLRRTGRVFSGSGGSDPMSASEMGKRCCVSSRTAAWYLKQAKACDRAIGKRNGLGKAADEEDREERRNQMRKGGEGGSSVP
jgi:hypothetical protein